MELIEPLHKNLVYVKSIDVKVQLDQATDIIPSKLWKKYCDFQDDYAERITVLRTEKREVPKEANGDKNMPDILHTWKGKINQQQPSQNYNHDTSCAFDSNRIRDYEERNKAFKSKSRLPATQAVKDIIPLMVHDIAYLKSFDVDWEVVPPALQNPRTTADDDDDEEPDTSQWCVSDPSTVPFKELKIPKRGKLPPYLFVALAIVYKMEPRPREFAKFFQTLMARVEQLKSESDKENATLADALTRNFSNDEWEIYRTGMDLELSEDEDSAQAERNGGASKCNSSASPAKCKIASGNRSASATTTSPRGGGKAGSAGKHARQGEMPAPAPSPPPGEAAETGEALETGAAPSPPSPPPRRPAEAGAAQPFSSPPRPRPATPPSSPSGRGKKRMQEGETESDSDLDKVKRAAGRGGRKKAVSTVKPVPMTTHIDGRDRKRPERYIPPDTARVIVAKQRKKQRQESPPAVNTHEIPISVQSNRAMAGHLEINKRFPKTYMSIDPIHDAPLPNMTLSGAWHAVSCQYTL